MPKVDIKRLVRAGARIIAYLAPIQTGFDYVERGKLSWLGIRTQLGLLQVLVNLCWIAGLTFILWLVSLLLWLIVAVVIFGSFEAYRIGSAEFRAKLVRILAVVVLYSSICTVIAIEILGRHNMMNPLSDKLDPPILGWVFALVGAIVLAVVYKNAFDGVLNALKDDRGSGMR